MKRLAIAALLIAPACTAAPSGTSCHSAVDRYWPAGSRAWAHSIVQRESRGIATAQNRYSSAAGCFQLLKMHWWRIPGGGARRYDAAANTLGALSLYRQAGTRPWAT